MYVRFLFNIGECIYLVSLWGYKKYIPYFIYIHSYIHIYIYMQIMYKVYAKERQRRPQTVRCHPDQHSGLEMYIYIFIYVFIFIFVYRNTYFSYLLINNSVNTCMYIPIYTERVYHAYIYIYICMSITICTCMFLSFWKVLRLREGTLRRPR